MKATLTFHLPDDEYEYRAASEGQRARCVLHDVAEAIRRKTKYSSAEDSNDTVDAYEAIRRLFYDACDEHGIMLDW
jgi:hypothetical protein